MKLDEKTKNELSRLYKMAKKVELEGHGSGWVDLAAFGWAVNKAKINYKGIDGIGKLSSFLLDAGIFEIITVKNKFIRIKQISGLISTPDDDTLLVDIPEAIEQQKVESPPIKQLTIFEEEETESMTKTLLLEPHDISTCHSQIDDVKQQLFGKLKQAKQKDWETFSKPDYIGIWKSIIEKYPETAHFIYELIQNADDALATEAAIVLYKDKLVFKHNGKRQFSLTDADNHEDMMGDINSITSVACSTKKDEEQTIGKFGVGFKSVFQYTESPSIYDDTFWFKIENYIIPTLLESDHELRNEGETLFEIPFKNPEKAYREIHLRLMDLRMPVLFLPHVQRIVWKVDGELCLHEYSKQILQSNTRNGIKYDFCRINDFQKKHFLYLFKREYQTSQGLYPISVGYYLNPDGSLKTNSKSSVYCFFPTSEKFEGCFVCHAPFLLTDNRDSIKAFERVNTEFLHGIAQLAADALICLRDIGTYRTPRLLELFDEKEQISKSSDRLLINDNIFHLSNIKSTEERDECLKNCYLDVIRKSDIILTRSNRYVNRDVALVPTYDIESLLNSQQLSLLYNSDNCDFVYIKQYRTDVRELADSIGITTFDNERLAVKLSKSFMQEQQPEWIKRLLVYIEEKARNLWVLKDDSPRTCCAPRTESYGWGYYRRIKEIPGSDSWSTLKFRFAPIVKTSKGDWISPYTLYKKEANVILPFTGFEDVEADFFGITMDEALYNEHKDFYNKLGLKRPSLIDYIEKIIVPHYPINGTPSDNTIIKDFSIIYNILSSPRNHDSIIKILKEKWKVKCNKATYDVMCFTWEAAIPNEDYVKFMGTGSNLKYINCDYYAEGTGISVEDVKSFFKEKFSIPDNPIVKEKDYFAEEQSYAYSGKKYSYNNFPHCAIDFLSRCSLAATKEPSYKDYYLEGYNINNRSKEWSHILWNYVLKCGVANYSKAILKYYEYRARYSQEAVFDSTYLSNLKTDNWISKEDGTFCCPKEISLEEFHDLGYEKNDSIEKTLGFWDYIKDDLEEKDRQARLLAEEKERNDLLHEAMKKGININELLKNALSGHNEVQPTYTSLVTESNKDAISTIVGVLNDEEINQLAESIRQGNYASTKQSQDVPAIIVNNIEPLANITEVVGEENLPMVAEHVGEFMNWMLDEDEDRMPSMVRRIVKYIGKKIYENYLINEGIDYEALENDTSDCDYLINDNKYVRVISTLKSIVDNRIPIGLSAAQNAFLKQHPDKEIRIIRISFKDIFIFPQYTRIVDLCGKEDDPEQNERLSAMCDNLARNYWSGVEIEEFDNASPEYSIKIERKN